MIRIIIIIIIIIIIVIIIVIIMITFFLKIVMIFIHNSVRIFTDVYRTKTNSALRTKMNTNSGELA